MLFSTVYIINALSIPDMIIPSKPFIPNFPKNRYISLPDAKPAPTIVPIITIIILFTFFNIELPE